jgi:hypothetical protein
MTAASEQLRDALSGPPELRQLWRLLTNPAADPPWRFLDLREISTPPQLGFARRWAVGWLDILLITHQEGAIVTRYNPDRAPVWTHEGTLADVLAEIEVLPAPETRLAPRLVIPGRNALLPALHPGLPGQRGRHFFHGGR